MVFIVYPSTLPVPSVGIVTPAERRLLSDLTGGPVQFRGVQRDYLASRQVAWSNLTATEAAAMDGWFTAYLNSGGSWFGATWPAPQGNIQIVYRFIGAPQWQYVAGGFWNVSALMQVRGRGLPPAIDPTVLLLHFDGSIADAKGHNTSLYSVPGFGAESAVISASSPIMGTGSLVTLPYQSSSSFSNIIVKVDTSTDFDLPGAFTIEFSQIGQASFSSQAIPLCRGSFDATDFLGNFVDNTIWKFQVLAGNIGFVCKNQDGSNTGVSAAYTSGVLQRYAVTRDTSNVLRLYIEGALVKTTPGVDATLTGTQPVAVNGPYQTLSPLPNAWSSGKYDEVRISKNVALYTGASYTLATSPFP